MTAIPMRLTCPSCGELHIDKGEFATKEHHTHACQNCGMVWRPAVVPTVGVRFLPGFKNEHNHHRLDGGPEPTGAAHDRMHPDCPVTESGLDMSCFTDDLPNARLGPDRSS